MHLDLSKMKKHKFARRQEALLQMLIFVGLVFHVQCTSLPRETSRNMGDTFFGSGLSRSKRNGVEKGKLGWLVKETAERVTVPVICIWRWFALNSEQSRKTISLVVVVVVVVVQHQTLQSQ